MRRASWDVDEVLLLAAFIVISEADESIEDGDHAISDIVLPLIQSGAELIAIFLLSSASALVKLKNKSRIDNGKYKNQKH